MAILKPLILAIAATSLPSTLGFQPHPRDVTNNDPYPFCSPASNPDCIEDGKYLVPPLDFSAEDHAGDLAYKQYLPTHTFTVSQWTNGKMPERCYYFAVTADSWNPADFVMYNVTFSDCTGTPYVVCWHNKSSKTISQIATVSSNPMDLHPVVTDLLPCRKSAGFLPRCGRLHRNASPCFSLPFFHVS